jgi:hypothetical protein
MRIIDGGDGDRPSVHCATGGRGAAGSYPCGVDGGRSPGVPDDEVVPMAVVLLATACVGCTGAAAPGDAVGKATGALLAAACAGCTGAAAPVDVAEVPGEGLGVPNPALICAGGGVGASTRPWMT